MKLPIQKEFAGKREKRSIYFSQLAAFNQSINQPTIPPFSLTKNSLNPNLYYNTKFGHIIM